MNEPANHHSPRLTQQLFNSVAIAVISNRLCRCARNVHPILLDVECLHLVYFGPTPFLGVTIHGRAGSASRCRFGRT